MADLSDRALLLAAAENHRVWFRRTCAAAGKDVIAVGATELFVDREAMVFPAGQCDVDAVVAEIRLRKCAGAGWWSLAANHELGTALVAHGFGWGWRPHWMAIDLRSLDDESPDTFAIERARPPFATKLPYATRRPWPPGTVDLGVRLHGELVGQAVVNPDGRVAGIYSMGVAAPAQRRGIGLALTSAACRAARAAGCEYAILNATQDGTELYRRAGFHSLGWGQTWWFFPAREPSAREAALITAAGSGDLTALEDLSPSLAEVTEAVPGGETALSLAVVTRMTAVIEHFLESWPELTAARFGPHGATLLHLAAEQDQPELASVALAHGADPDLRDTTFNATAHGWAEHFGNERVTAAIDQA